MQPPPTPDADITNLEALVAALGEPDRKRFGRIFRVSFADGFLRLPAPMVPWVEGRFGSVQAVERQRVVRVTNLVTSEGTLFNGLRGLRPMQTAPTAASTDATGGASELADALRADPWAEPLGSTAEDTFGRLSGPHGVTAANVAKYDAMHSLVVFAEADPLAFTAESIAGQLDLARRWFGAAHAVDPEACYPYVLWNCLWRAGGSVVHGHLQLALARGGHYGRIERLRRDAEAYHAEHGASYFDDLVLAHERLGLALDGLGSSVRGIVHLTPLKEKEVLLFARALDGDTAGALYRVLAAFRDHLGVRSFNVGVLLPPIAPVPESWDGFPVIVRIIDRGGLGSRTSDFGGMELFAESVVASDPFAVARVLAARGRTA